MMSLADTIPAKRLELTGLKPARATSHGPLAGLVESYREGSSGPHWHSDWAWAHYEPLTLALAFHFNLKTMLEIGGGREPGFLELGREAGLEVAVNDVDPRELALLPAGTKSACFDIAGNLKGRPDLREAYDLVAARMVFEHIDGVPQAWRNIHRMLRPGGVALAFFPTLYAWPFTLNRFLPARLAKRIVERFFPARAADGRAPFFPAHYDHCFGSERKLRRMLDPIGFSEMVVMPFWGHHYLDRVPVAREIDAVLNRAAAALDGRFFTTYAVVVVRK
jgi:SAM-dependent methyltransferase